MGVDEKWLVDQESQGWRLLYWMQFAHPQSDDSSFALGQSLSKEPLNGVIVIFAPYNKNSLSTASASDSVFIGRKRMQS